MGQQPPGSSMVTIMQLIDELQMVIENGRRVSIMNLVGIDEQHAMSLIDQLRATIPTEVALARRVIQDRQEIILAAQRQAEELLNDARKQVNYMVSDVGLLAEARQIGESEIRHAKTDAQRTRQAVTSYALGIFDELEEALKGNLQNIERAREVLRDSAEREALR
jgi:hypothetical protein